MSPLKGIKNRGNICGAGLIKWQNGTIHLAALKSLQGREGRPVAENMVLTRTI